MLNCFLVGAIPCIWSSLSLCTELLSTSLITDLRQVREEPDLHRILSVHTHWTYRGELWMLFIHFLANPPAFVLFKFLTLTEHSAMIFTLITTSRPIPSMFMATQKFVMSSENCLFPRDVTLHLPLLKSSCYFVVRSIDYH